MKLLVGLLMCSSVAFGSQEFTNIIKCHEALDGKSVGRSLKLDYLSATPIALVNKNEIYFMTDSGFYVLSEKYQGKNLLIHLKNNEEDFYRQMSFGKKGDIQSLSYDEVKNTEKALMPELLADSSLAETLFKKDLLRRIRSMAKEHQNKFDPDDTLNALEICQEISIRGLKKNIQKLKSYYQDVQGKPQAYAEGFRKKPRTAQAK